MKSIPPVDKNDAKKIYQNERDANLSLHTDWPPRLPGWNTQNSRNGKDGYHYRVIDMEKGRKILEAVVRFPSAPIYGLHRKYQYRYQMPRINYHTLRILRRPFGKNKPSKIKRLYLFHNGLNETEQMGFYHDIADFLMGKETDCACLIRPIPGHLTRFPFIRNFAEKPLDKYIADAGDLFRQFLRYMLESQWLYSILGSLPRYNVVNGLRLLEGHDDATLLGKNIYKDWKAAFDANKTREREAGVAIKRKEIPDIVNTIRYLVGWTPSYTKNDGPPNPKDLEPRLHVMGYSLGGFFAQSAFFTWPYLIASCTTICSGGPLRDIAPTAFAHPEEWQTVIHALRYELANAMIAGNFRNPKDKDTVAGINPSQFGFFEKAFYEVFLQDDHGTYKSRVSDYANRLFFVVGGCDPIVPPKSVLDASPSEGVNLIQISNLSHFIAIEKDKEWKKFWLPEVIRITGSYTRHAEGLHFQSIHDNWWKPDFSEVVSKPASDPILPKPSFDESLELGGIPLEGLAFQRTIGDIVRKVTEGGAWLFLFRNNVPVILLGKTMLHRRGTALYYSDGKATFYVRSLMDWSNKLYDHGMRITLCVPEQQKNWFTQRAPLLSPRTNPAGGQIPTEKELKKIWQTFLTNWTKQPRVLRYFDCMLEYSTDEAVELEANIRHSMGIDTSEKKLINTLPDVWMLFNGNIVTNELAQDAPVGSSIPKNIHSTYNDTRKRVEKGFLKMVNKIATNDPEDGNKYKTWLKKGDLKIIKVSPAEFNPRYRGLEIRSEKLAKELLLHTGLAYIRSTVVGKNFD